MLLPDLLQQLHYLLCYELLQQQLLQQTLQEWRSNRKQAVTMTEF